MHRKVGLPRRRVGGRRRGFAEPDQRALLLEDLVHFRERRLDLLLVARLARAAAAGDHSEKEHEEKEAERPQDAVGHQKSPKLIGPVCAPIEGPTR